MKMRESILLTLLLLFNQDLVGGVRIVELRVPAHAAAGSNIMLGCQFDVEDDMLYSVKWYKDGREFYRYVPNNRNPAIGFRIPGVVVDMSRSSSDIVTLLNLKQESAGVYRCEVSGEAPLFATDSDEKLLVIHILPKSAPVITGLSDKYQYGDRLSANCSSAASSPRAQLKWLINDKVVPSFYVRGPWYRETLYNPGTYETILQVSFIVKSSHFYDDVMELKCQATIAPLYQQEVSKEIFSPEKKDLFDIDHYGGVTQANIEMPTTNSKIDDYEAPYNDKDDGSVAARSLCTMLLALLLQLVVL